MCPEWELNWQPFGSQPVLNPLSYTSQGYSLVFLINVILRRLFSECQTPISSYLVNISTCLSCGHINLSLIELCSSPNLLFLVSFTSQLMTLLSPQLAKIRNLESFIGSYIQLVKFLIGI